MKSGSLSRNARGVSFMQVSASFSLASFGKFQQVLRWKAFSKLVREFLPRRANVLVERICSSPDVPFLHSPTFLCTFLHLSPTFKHLFLTISRGPVVESRESGRATARGVAHFGPARAARPHACFAKVSRGPGLDLPCALPDLRAPRRAFFAGFPTFCTLFDLLRGAFAQKIKIAHKRSRSGPNRKSV